MKRLVFIFAFALVCTAISAQPVWNIKFPTNSAFPSFAKIKSEGGFYWVNTDDALFKISNSGNVAGQIDVGIGFSLFWLWGTQVTNPGPGEPYFLLARRAPTTSSGYTIAHYQPEVGIVNQVIFSDSLGGGGQGAGPVFIAPDESNLIVFGQKFIRKIGHNQSGSLTEIWAKSLVFKTTSAVWTGSQAIFCDPFGNFKAIDTNGGLLWSKTYPFSTKSIKMQPDGILGCGNTGAGEGLLFKLDFDGNLMWSQVLSEKKVNDIIPLSDGNIALTGETDALKLFVIKTNAAGNTIWNRTYGPGKGLKIEPAFDGGVVVFWQGAVPYRLNLAKLDADGNTAPEALEPVPIKDRTLHTSGAKALQHPLSGLFFNGISSDLRIPADSATSPIFVHSPWIGAHDASGNLHLAVSTYNNLRQNYRSGIASSLANDFDRLWAISREEIVQIRRDFGEDGDLDTPPPFDLLSWPAKGNPHFRHNLDFTLVTTPLDKLPAPFVDHNGDGTYNVYDGDYPQLLGDRMLWWVMTDQTVQEPAIGKPLEVDVLMTLYGYDCPLNGSVSSAIFADYQVINRSGKDYSDTYMGFYTDFDLGCPDDDYTGTLPGLNSYYVYNIDAVEGNPGTSCSTTAETYGPNVPIESVTILNHSMDQSIYINTFGDPPSFPNSPNEYYFYLQGLMCEEQLPTIGGTGCNPGSSNFTNFVFPDAPNNPSGWSMCAANLPADDRRSISSHGPFTFAAGDTFSMRLAFLFHPDIPLPCPDVAGLVMPTIAQIQQWHDEGTLDSHLDLGSVLTLAAGQSLQLNATQSNPATAYNWSTGQTTSIITVNQTGEYTVTITPATGCAYAETVLVKSASGVNSPTLPTWQVQPNPAHDVLKITFEGNAMPVTAILRNAQGQAALTKTSTENAVELSVANLPSGFYWAELWRNGLFLGSRKVVVAR